jgi:hypothetical protein
MRKYIIILFVASEIQRMAKSMDKGKRKSIYQLGVSGFTIKAQIDGITNNSSS